MKPSHDSLFNATQLEKQLRYCSCANAVAVQVLERGGWHGQTFCVYVVLIGPNSVFNRLSMV